MSITKILQGINRCEVEYTDGWWETETGATFGCDKLTEAQGYEAGLLQRITELEAENERLKNVAQFKEDVATTLRAQLADANQAAQRLRELDKQLSEMQPSYPTGQVIGSCVCGSWPGGECLKCEWIPSKDKAVKEST